MQIAINISHNLYESIMKDYALSKLGEHELYKAIRNGTPLPEHHGRLLILDERLVEQNLVSFNATTSFCNKWLSEVGISNSVVKIIPATKEGEGKG